MAVLSIALIMELPHAYAISGMSLFMKPNSTAKIYTDYTFRVLNNETWTLYPHITTSITNSSTPEGVTVIATPKSFVGNKHDVYVTYAITAQGHAKGLYVLSLYSCGLTPLAIGLNESEMNPTAFTDIVGATSCAVPPQNSPDMNIIGYSEIVSKNIQVDANNTLVVTSVNQLQILKSPLQQFQSGIKAEDVKCSDGFTLVIKSEDGSPACVNHDTANILRERGWASSIIITPSIIQQTSENNTLPNSFEPCDTPFTQSNNGIAVLYMPANSIGKICVRYSNPNEPKNASLTIFDASSYQTTKSITSWAEPSMIPSGNSTVRYSIKTGNQTGLYGLTIFCSGEPFAVGYDEKSNFTLNDFPWEKSQTISCPMMTYQYKIDSLSGIGVRYIPYP